MSAFFIAGTGTDVGKTFASTALIRAARAKSQRVAATKPVMSGYDAAKLAESDAGLLLAATGVTPTETGIDKIAPWRFSAPLAPTAAARREKRPLPYDDVLAFCRERLAAKVDLHVVEGAGGVMSPIAEEALVIDLIEDLELPVVLVAGDYLGAVSHALTAVEALGNRRIEVAAVVVNEAGKGGVGATATIEEIGAFLDEALLHPWRHGQREAEPVLLKALGLA
jgi:dethiobiotin synthetase